jgi:hypothetical protein
MGDQGSRESVATRTVKGEASFDDGLTLAGHTVTGRARVRTARVRPAVCGEVRPLMTFDAILSLRSLALLFMSSLLPLACRPAGADRPATVLLPQQQQATRAWLDSGACPQPENGIFAINNLFEHDVSTRRALYPHDSHGVVLYMITLPSFAPNSMVALEASPPELASGPAPPIYQAVLTWPGTDADDPPVSRVPIDLATAQSLISVWDALLLRTQYLEERDEFGTPVLLSRCDGTEIHFGTIARSGQAWSPNDGTVLHGVVLLGDALAQYVRAPLEHRPQVGADLRKMAAQALERIKKNEPCLRLQKMDGGE